MTYDLPTISAAIDTFAMREAQDNNVSPHDSDRLAPIMDNAIHKIAHQLALEGMNYSEAMKIAEKGAMEIGRESEESEALAERAYANREAQLPAENDAPQIAEHTAPEACAPVAPSPAASSVSAHTQAPDVHASAQHMAPRHDTPTPPVATPFIGRQATVAPTEPLLEHKVEMKPVLDIFPGLAQNPRSHLLQFDIPFITWDGGRLHPQIPKRKNYQFNFPDLFAALYAMATGTVTSIVGPTGCGKTELVKQIANRMNFPLTLVPMDGQITRNQLIGQRGLMTTPTGPQDVWRDGILARALKEPGILLLDEVDRGVSDVQYAVHSLYTGEGLTLLDDGGRIIPMNRFNRVFTTANTKGRGSMDGLYQATEEMTEATRNRLTQWIEMDYQSKEEDAVVLFEDVPGIDDMAVDYITKISAEIREQFKGAMMSQPCSMRDQIETAKRYAFLARMAKDDDERKLMVADCIMMVMGNRASEADKAVIETNIQTNIGVQVSTASLFRDSTSMASTAP